MKKLVGGSLFALALVFSAGFVTPVPAEAASLTSAQVSAIISLLQSFGADQGVINNVSVALGGSSSGSQSCNTFADLKYGDFDNNPGGRVSQLQTFLGIPSSTFGFGTYGRKTQAAWQSRCGTQTNYQNNINFTAYPSSGATPLAVQFSVPNENIVAGTSIFIDYGDGQGSNKLVPVGNPRVYYFDSHTYVSAGTYKARLFTCPNGTNTCEGYTVLGTATVTAIAPSSNNSSDIFSCNPSPQTANTVPLLVLCGGYGLSANSTYSIDFGDGSSSGTLTLSAPGHAFGPDGPTNKMANASHTYVSPGTYTITFYKNSIKIGSTVIVAVVPTMVRIFPANGKDSPSVSVRSEYASFVKMQILSEMPTAVPGLGYFGPVTTPAGATWIKYGGGSNGCSTYNYYQLMTSSSPQTILVSFTTCSPEYMPMDEHLRVLDTIAFG